MEHGKSKPKGIEERKEVLFSKDASLESVYDDAVKTFIEPPSWARRLSKNAKDDVLDALVLAYTAQRGDLATLPDEPEIDYTKGEPLPMEIVY